MKKIQFLLFIFVAIFAAVIFLKPFKNIVITGVVTEKNTLDVKPQQYYGATVDMSQILPESKHYIKNKNGEDLIDLASRLGMNTLRITNITSISNNLTPSYTHAQWAEVLDKMKMKNMYPVILVEANAQDASFNRVTLDDYYLNFVRNYIITPNLCSFSNIVAVDIANEPILNDNNLIKMQEASNNVKSACPAMKITVGSWGTDSGNKLPSGQPEYYWHDPKEVGRLNNIVDIYSVHIYGFDKPLNGPYPDPYKLTSDYLNLMRKYTSKPIFIEEFGAGNGEALTDQNTLGSQELQKNVYAGLLKAAHDFRNKGVLGATAYLLYPRSDSPDSWSIAKDNGNTLLPAAYTFKE